MRIRPLLEQMLQPDPAAAGSMAEIELDDREPGSLHPLARADAPPRGCPIQPDPWSRSVRLVRGRRLALPLGVGGYAFYISCGRRRRPLSAAPPAFGQKTPPPACHQA